MVIAFHIVEALFALFLFFEQFFDVRLRIFSHQGDGLEWCATEVPIRSPIAQMPVFEEQAIEATSTN